MKQNKKGFTLIELLVVVLIIGVLAAIALPMYQKAVLKSRFTSMMPVAKTLAGANEVYYAEHDRYATAPTQLNVTIQDNLNDGTAVLMYSNPEDLSFVRVRNSGVPNAQYVIYQKLSKNFPDTTWCEAGDTKAEELCVALGGTLPEGISGNSSGEDGWKAYLLSGTAREGDTFAAGSGEGNTNSCQAGDTPPASMPNVEQTSANAPTGKVTGTAACVNGKWVYQWTGGNTYGEYEECEGDSAYACAGSSFSGEDSGCEGTDENACAGSTFSGVYSYCRGLTENACVGSSYSGEGAGCWTDAKNGCTGSSYSGERSQCIGLFAYGCTGSTFSGLNSGCQGSAANACEGSTFSGEDSSCDGNAKNACAGSTISGERARCWGNAENACAGTTIQAGAYCTAVKEGGCDGAIYTTHPEKGNTLTGCCTGSYCPAGSPKCGSWNSTTHAYDIDGTW